MIHRATRGLAAAALAAALAACGKEVPPFSEAQAPVAAGGAPEIASAPAAPAAAESAAAPSASEAPPFLGIAPRRVVLEDQAMGTHILLATFTTDALDEAAVRAKLEKALGEIRRLEGLMTTWRPDSEISLVNAAAGKSLHLAQA